MLRGCLEEVRREGLNCWVSLLKIIIIIKKIRPIDLHWQGFREPRKKGKEKRRLTSENKTPPDSEARSLCLL